MSTSAVPSSVMNLRAARGFLLEHALTRSFRGGKLAIANRDVNDFFGVLQPQLEFAAWAALEWRAPGSHEQDPRIVEAALAAIEEAVTKFGAAGRVTEHGDGNTAYFAMAPMTLALLTLKTAMPPTQCERIVSACVKLFDAATEHINLTHDYLNPRAKEALVALNLFQLTGEQRFLDRCHECLDELLTRQYPCGAQPYHTGGWIWGRRPAHLYQLLSGTMMILAGRALQRTDVAEYVVRMMRYLMQANNRHGEPLITPFEALYKCDTAYTVARQWPLAAALGPEFAPLASTGYKSWAKRICGEIAHADQQTGDCLLGLGYVPSLYWALALGVDDLSPTPEFLPPQGIQVCPDISTFFVHEAEVDLAATLLTGYSAFAQIDYGDVRLYAATLELTDAPTWRNAGTDALRLDWQKPTEQLACHHTENGARLCGRVFTKWDCVEHNSDVQFLHARELEVTLTYSANELLLEFETVANKHATPVANRLLFLLKLRAPEARAHVTIGGESFHAPAAVATEAYCQSYPLGPVRFAAPDGSTIEILPEFTSARHILAERPLSSSPSRPANEVTLRLSFEGPAALDRGRFRILMYGPR